MAHFSALKGRWIVAAQPLIFPLLMVLGLATLGGTVGAQALPAGNRGPLEAEEQALFQQTLKNPADVAATLAYADVAARLGDNEAAVTALERLLLFNPNLPRVDLELGTLYFRMRSFDLARTYFEKAASGGAPADVADRAKQYLGDIAAETSPGRLSGYLFSGLQYQSDANVAPGSPAFQSLLGPQLLGSHFVKQSDTNFFGAGSALYSYDLGTQNRDTLEILGTAFAQHYFHVDDFDLAFAELTAGPRFNFARPGSDTASSIKPYLIANNVLLAANEFFYTYGAGIEGRTVLFDDLLLKSVFEFRQKNYSNSENVTGTVFNGNDKLVSLQLKKPVPFIKNSELSLEFDYLDQATHKTFLANTTYGATVAYEIRYGDPTGYSRFLWDTTVFGGRLWSTYDSPDPCCSTSGIPGVFSPSSRSDRHWRFGINHVVQVAENFDLVLQFQRDVISSNLPIYAYSSNSVVVGPKIRF